MSSGGTAPWPDAMCAAFIELRYHEPKLAMDEIARRLGVTKNAACGKARRLAQKGLIEAWPNPCKRGPGHPLRSYAERLARHREAPVVAPKPAEYRATANDIMSDLHDEFDEPIIDLPLPTPVKPVMKAPPQRPAPERPYGRIVNCCWPISERPYRFCGDTSEPGKPYCAPHAKLAYVPKRVLEETGD